VAIKLLEWFIKNTPKNMHVIELFKKPFELEGYCKDAGLRVMKMTGIRPLISSIDWKMIRTGIVSSKMKFTLTKSTLLSYMGVSIKDGAQWAPFH
jgi:2-polyprenyl-6-hydroxyphenyl methylase/3-demethylubiquinone-9 3-methyltransferase